MRLKSHRFDLWWARATAKLHRVLQLHGLTVSGFAGESLRYSVIDLWLTVGLFLRVFHHLMTEAFEKCLCFGPSVYVLFHFITHSPKFWGWKLQQVLQKVCQHLSWCFAWLCFPVNDIFPEKTCFLKYSASSQIKMLQSTGTNQLFCRGFHNLCNDTDFSDTKYKQIDHL